ncbi:PLP-dependent transferase [Panaeolus papilionaceus]|nr:PLP-dependent transferase [Panaeolus papilionaceus]
MGNSHSNRIPPPIHLPENKIPPVKRKRSYLFSRINFSCTSIDSYLDNYGPSQTTLYASTTNEKAVSPKPSYEFKPETLPIYSSIRIHHNDQETRMFQDFLKEYPNYQLTWILDALRRTDYTRLDQGGEVYVDYMGGALYPESLIRVHTQFLTNNILGNTHSVSNSSKLSFRCADEARSAVLSHFKASASEYTVIFTANASAAMKLVAESYQFREGSKLVIGADSHNSIHGMREFATQKSAQTVYIPSTPHGGVDHSTAKNMLLRHRPRTSAPCLYAMTGQSNISNSKTSLSLIHYASSIGYHTLLDAAALAPTSVISLADSAVDAMAISFYKMFGFPTGVGALIVKKKLLEQLRRPWFAGGTVDVVQVPGDIVTRAHQLHEQFEDGTINYLSLPAITEGLRFLSAYLPFMPLRLTSLLLYLSSSLSKLRHDTTRRPVVKILSRLPSRKLQHIGEQSDAGFILALLFLDPSGQMIPNSFIEYAASTQNISLRTGCMCNPGGAAAMLGIVDAMQQLYPGVTLADFEARMGHELGVIRISLGLSTNFHDIWRVIQFATSISQEQPRQRMWSQWAESREGQIGQAL